MLFFVSHKKLRHWLHQGIICNWPIKTKLWLEEVWSLFLSHAGAEDKGLNQWTDKYLPGLGSDNSAIMDITTFSTPIASDHIPLGSDRGFRILRQTWPFVLMLQWNIRVLKLTWNRQNILITTDIFIKEQPRHKIITLGGVKGYVSGMYIVILKFPPLYGVSFGPFIVASHLKRLSSTKFTLQVKHKLVPRH